MSIINVKTSEILDAYVMKAYISRELVYKKSYFKTIFLLMSNFC